MKVLLPYLSYDGNTLDDPKVIGGIEMFAKNIYQNIEETIPFYYTNEDRSKRTVTKKCLSMIENCRPDLLVVNYDTTTLTTRIQEFSDIPILWIVHVRGGAINSIPLVKHIHKFVENGGTLCMVSEHQYHSYNKISLRTHFKELPISSYINSSFCIGNEKVYKELIYDAVTIGRVSEYKDPFWLFEKMKGSNKHSLIMTNDIEDFLYGDNINYFNKNKHWTYPQEIIKNLSHEDTMRNLSQSKCYISTCKNETWGITAMEALSRGVPLILATDSTNAHASESIAADPSHYIKVKRSVKRKVIWEAVDKLASMTYNDRIHISEQTKLKHSKEAWISHFYDILDMTLRNRSNVTNLNKNLTEFFS